MTLNVILARKFPHKQSKLEDGYIYEDSRKQEEPTEFVCVFRSIDSSWTMPIVMNAAAAAMLEIGEQYIINVDDDWEKSAKQAIVPSPVNNDPWGGIPLSSIWQRTSDGANGITFASLNDFNFSIYKEQKINRSQLSAMVPEAWHMAQEIKKSNGKGNLGQLLGLESEEQSRELHIPDIPEFPIETILANEKKALGFYLNSRPMDAYRETLERMARHRTVNLSAMGKNTEVTLGGMITSVRSKKMRNLKWMGKATFEDFTGTIDLLFWDRQWELFKDVAVEGFIGFVKGSVTRQGGPDDPTEVAVGSIVSLQRTITAIAAKKEKKS